MTTKTNPSVQDVHMGLIILLIIAVVGVYFISYDTRSDMHELTEKHYNLAGKVSGIEIKGDDTANQLTISIENQYWIEIREAINIASNAGYNGYTKIIWINPGLNTLRLSNIEGMEIQVNIETKVITTYSPQ